MGDINGFVSFNGFFPNTGVTAAVLANLESATPPAEIATRLAGAVFGHPHCLQATGACAEMA